MYQYVAKSKYNPVRKELDQIIGRVQKIMKAEYETSFQYQLIGSGGRHLITCIENGNSGYDFDYNLIIRPPQEGYSYDAKILKHQFITAFKRALQGTKYRDPQDRSSVISIKVVDKINQRIIHSCDFAIIYYDQNKIENGYLYLKHYKAENSYGFEFRKSSYKIEEKIDNIREYQNGWNMIRDEYLKLKNINIDDNKTSNSLYFEAVNNVYNSL